MTPMVSATIDTAALRHNLQVVRRAAPKSRIMAVIKANAYGHGLVTVARALDSADAFGVARADEGLALRAAGIKAPIVLLEGVLNGEQLAAAASADFELVVHSPEQIELLRSSMRARFKVWLKLDSGMNRLGFKSAEFRQAHATLSALPAVEAVNLMTHLASADQPELSTTVAQLAVFDGATQSLAGERSIASSAALLRRPESQTTWVRRCLGLDGVSPCEGW